MSIFDIFKPIQRRVRMFFRQRMLPMSVDEAMEKREFFAKLYFLTSFSLFTYLLYQMFKEKVHSVDTKTPLGEATIEKLKIDGKVRVMRFEGLTKVQDYYYERKQEEKEDEANPKANLKQEEVNPDIELLVKTIPEVESEVL